MEQKKKKTLGEIKERSFVSSKNVAKQHLVLRHPESCELLNKLVYQPLFGKVARTPPNQRTGEGLGTEWWKSSLIFVSTNHFGLVSPRGVRIHVFPREIFIFNSTCNYITSRRTKMK